HELLDCGVVASLPVLGKHRHEGHRERALGRKPAQEIGDAERDEEGVHGRVRTKHGRVDLVADQARNARDEGHRAEHRGGAQQPRARRRDLPAWRKRRFRTAHALPSRAPALLTQMTESPIISGSVFPKPGPSRLSPFTSIPVSRILSWPTSSPPRSAPSRPSCATRATRPSVRSCAPPSRRSSRPSTPTTPPAPKPHSPWPSRCSTVSARAA